MLREIITIDEEKCTGCGECIPNCPEGALQIIDGKAKLVGDLLCDGLGACIGHCPEGAISVEKREAEEYDERVVMENVIKEGPAVIKQHLEHLKEHGQTEFLMQAVTFLEERGIENPLHDPLQMLPGTPAAGCGCPGSRVIDLRAEDAPMPAEGIKLPRQSRLRQWPVQIMLVPPTAPYFKNADLLIAADCVPFAYPSFHEDLLDGKVLLVGCPKLDNSKFYEEKITEILSNNDIQSVTVAFMEVPCCMGMVQLAKSAIGGSGKEIPFETVKLGIRGDRLSEIPTTAT
jgi:NAD-dependent dihydropyrimidine dehydrogenase PreA subunit